MLPPLAIGPLMMPPGLWLLVLMAVAAAIGMRLAGVRRGGRHEDNETLIFWVVLGGLLAARVGFVALQFADYRVEPWSMLNLRDGGWHPGDATDPDPGPRRPTRYRDRRDRRSPPRPPRAPRPRPPR